MKRFWFLLSQHGYWAKNEKEPTTSELSYARDVIECVDAKDIAKMKERLVEALEVIEFYAGNFDGREGSKWNGDTFFAENKFGCSETAHGPFMAIQFLKKFKVNRTAAPVTG